MMLELEWIVDALNFGLINDLSSPVTGIEATTLQDGSQGYHEGRAFSSADSKVA